jgi:hypothetical protein
MAAAAASMISPTSQSTASPMDTSEDDSLGLQDPQLPSILNNLQGGNTLETTTRGTAASLKPEDEVFRSPVKSKQKKGTSILQTNKSSRPNPELHHHKHPRVIIKTSIKLKETNPFNKFIVALQSLLKNGQLVDPHFTFCPIKPDSCDKKIHAHADILVNMTMLSTHFQISISNGRNPFEKQKI